MASAAPSTDRGERRGLPQVFGRYLLLQRLSRGGMGEIFLAKLGEIQGFEKPVIIKKVLPQLAADEEFVRRFIDEAQVAIKLNHANIAPVYEVGKVDGDYFLAIEYVEGRDLRRLLARSSEERFRLPPDLCLYIGRELASGLGYAHRRTDPAGNALALVHCDVSPPNVMISFEGEVKIIDFGIAKSAVRIAGSNPNVGFGKFGYMAPEQLMKDGVVDRRTDIYAAGVVLYELLTGERLFQFPDGADYRQIARIVAKGEFVPPSKRVPGIDRTIDPIVAKALATKPADRYQTGEEFRDALQSKLSQMNPTISADALAALMKRLFVDEIISERALIAETRLVDIGEYQDEIAGSVGHTVTFARAGLLPRRSTLQVKPLAAPHLRPRRRPLMLASVVALAMVSGGLITWLVARGPSPVAARPAPPVVVAPPTPIPTPVAVPAPPVVHPYPLPVPTPPTTARRPRPTAAPTPPPILPTLPAPVIDPGLDPHNPPSTPALTREEERARLKQKVVPRFQDLNRDYARFRVSHGDVLRPLHDALLQQAGPPDTLERLRAVDALIDQLREKMSAIKTGESTG